VALYFVQSEQRLGRILKSLLPAISKTFSKDWSPTSDISSSRWACVVGCSSNVVL
jgi:hypothetical protein